MKKILIAGFATLTLLLPVAAGAQTTADLQLQLSALIAQLAKMQSQAGTQVNVQANASVSANATTNGNCQFTRNLFTGLFGQDVRCLQGYLIEEGFLKVSATGYFGTATRTAVMNWQRENGVTAVGNFGTVSRATYARLVANAGNGSGDDTAANPTPAPAPITASVSATIDQASLATSSAMPTISGYAYNVVQALGISISDSGGKVWGSGNIAVTNNRWSATVNNLYLAAGTYTVSVYSGNVFLTSGTLTTTASTSTAAKNNTITALYPLTGYGVDNSGGKDSGLIANIQWRQDKSYPVSIYLLDSNNQVVRTIAINVSGSNYGWKYDPSLPDGKYQLRIDVLYPACDGGQVCGGQDNAYSGYFTVSRLQQSLTLTSVMPADAVPGSRVTVYGSGFNYATYIAIDGNYGIGIQPNAITLSGSTQLSFTLPTGISAGNHSIQAQEKAGSALSNTINFTVGASASRGPTLSYITPTKVKGGDKVYVYGTNFNQSTYVAFDGNYGLTIWPDNAPGAGSQILTFTVPLNTAAGTHSVQVAEKGSSYPLSSSVNLTVGVDAAPLPVITSLSSYSAVAGTVVYIYGYNFPTNAQIHLDSQSASPIVVPVEKAGNTVLSFTVPTTVPLGAHALQVIGEKSGSQISNGVGFMVVGSGSINVTYSPVGQTITNKKVLVNWTTQGSIGNIGIGFCPLGQPVTGDNCTMEASFPNTGSASVDLVGALSLYPGQWVVHVMDTSNPATYGRGNGAFIIGSTATAPMATISMNSGFNNPTYNAGDNGRKIASFQVSASNAQAVGVGSVTLAKNGNAALTLQNMYMKVNGVQFGTTLTSVGNSATFSGNQITVPAGASIIFDVYADILSTVPGGTYYSVLNLTSWSAGGLISGSAIPFPGTVNGQTITIAGSTTGVGSGAQTAPSVAMNSGFNNPTHHPGDTNKKIASFEFRAPADNNMTYGTFGFKNNSSVLGLQNLKVMIGGTQIGQTQAVVTKDSLMNFQSYFATTVQAGSAVYVDVYADILSSTPADVYSGVISMNFVSANYVSPWGTYSLPSPVSGQMITIQ